MRGKDEERSRSLAGSHAEDIAFLVDPDVLEPKFDESFLKILRPHTFFEWRRGNLADSRLLIEGLRLDALHVVQCGADIGALSNRNGLGESGGCGGRGDGKSDEIWSHGGWCGARPRGEVTAERMAKRWTAIPIGRSRRDVCAGVPGTVFTIRRR